MARPLKQGMDYFSHDTNASNDVKIEALMSEHGNIGYAFFFRMLEMIYKTENGELDLSKPVIKKSIAKKFGETIEVFDALLSCALEVGLFDKLYYEENQVLTSNGIKKRLVFVEKNREKYRSKKSKTELSQEKTEFSPEKTLVIPREKCTNQTKLNQTKDKPNKRQTKENEMKRNGNEMKAYETTDRQNETREEGAVCPSVRPSSSARALNPFFKGKKITVLDPERILRFINSPDEVSLLRDSNYSLFKMILGNLEAKAISDSVKINHPENYVCAAIENMIKENAFDDYFEPIEVNQ
jgi:hypothetical protein